MTEILKLFVKKKWLSYVLLSLLTISSALLGYFSASYYLNIHDENYVMKDDFRIYIEGSNNEAIPSRDTLRIHRFQVWKELNLDGTIKTKIFCRVECLDTNIVFRGFLLPMGYFPIKIVNSKIWISAEEDFVPSIVVGGKASAPPISISGGEIPTKNYYGIINNYMLLQRINGSNVSDSKLEYDYNFSRSVMLLADLKDIKSAIAKITDKIVQQNIVSRGYNESDYGAWTYNYVYFLEYLESSPLGEMVKLHSRGEKTLRYIYFTNTIICDEVETKIFVDEVIPEMGHSRAIRAMENLSNIYKLLDDDPPISEISGNKIHIIKNTFHRDTWSAGILHTFIRVDWSKAARRRIMSESIVFGRVNSFELVTEWEPMRWLPFAGFPISLVIFSICVQKLLSIAIQKIKEQ